MQFKTIFKWSHLLVHCVYKPIVKLLFNVFIANPCFIFACREYLRNIGIVDDGVKKMVSVMEDYFGHDGRTAYVLTADHGMTNWGM